MVLLTPSSRRVSSAHLAAMTSLLGVIRQSLSYPSRVATSSADRVFGRTFKGWL